MITSIWHFGYKIQLFCTKKIIPISYTAQSRCIKNIHKFSLDFSFYFCFQLYEYAVDKLLLMQSLLHETFHTNLILSNFVYQVTYKEADILHVTCTVHTLKCYHYVQYAPLRNVQHHHTVQTTGACIQTVSCLYWINPYRRGTSVGLWLQCYINKPFNYCLSLMMTVLT